MAYSVWKFQWLMSIHQFSRRPISYVQIEFDDFLNRLNRVVKICWSFFACHLKLKANGEMPLLIEFESPFFRPLVGFKKLEPVICPEQFLSYFIIFFIYLFIFFNCYHFKVLPFLLFIFSKLTLRSFGSAPAVVDQWPDWSPPHLFSSQ